ncbi:carbohydrate binding domain-containing protein [Paractinoplanes atraurantiacus]|uniref:Carbohydrate binding domain-containing protein n=1 Tax=Paractinoplanes atraurantiacus TaxID=1036182 RepID=A0A285GRK1_9ACTN|nr:carbohydrate binding domain-containing protein [Actinoplanes atraurantiacus]SNY24951.1 Carbohydrate binding domain-containing protein [Actinoplanes atraurantiacus]
MIRVDSDNGGAPAARNAEAFVAELRRLRARAGDPSFRHLSRLAAAQRPADPLPPSTISDVLAGKRLPRLPRLEFVEAYVAACLTAEGQDEPGITAEVARWRALWRSLATPEKLEEQADSVRPEQPPRRRRLTLLALAAAVFLAGLGAGVAGTLGWTGRHRAVADPATAADTCVPAGTAPPAGQDVLRLPSPGRKTGSWWVNDTGAATLSTDGRRFRADVIAGTSRPGDLIIVKSDVTLVQGRAYALTFSAAADRATTIRVRVQDSQPPAYQASHDREVSVGRDTCHHHYRFVAQKSSDHSELTFQVGGRPHDFQLHVSNAALVALPD